MRLRIARTALAALALSACAGLAPAPDGPVALVAGWDFSQYPVDDMLSLDAEHFTATLDANYSDLDPTSGAGAESARFGTMHLDGRFGSSQAPLGSDDPFVPSAAARSSLRSNLDAPAGVRFDCFKVLRQEGQLFAGPLVMTALRPAAAVFAADLSSVPELGEDWSLRFAGRSSVGSVPVEIDFSSDGDSYRRAGRVELSDADSAFEVRLGSKRSQRAYVRLAIAPHPETVRYQQAFLDNVAIRARLVTPPGAAPTPLVALSAAERACP
jgi:hypothetical protein